MPSQHAFTPLQPVTVNGDAQPPKQCRRICGVKAKIVVAAVLLLLLLIIFTAAIVMVAIASADKEPRSEEQSEGETSEITDSTPLADRVSCPLRSQQSCIKGGCLYSTVDEDNQPLPDGAPKCFYSLKTVGGTYDIDDSSDDSVILSIGEVDSRRRRREESNSTYTVSDSTATPNSTSIYKVADHEDWGFCVQRDGDTTFDLQEPASLNIMSKFISITLAVPTYTKAYGLGNFGQLEKPFDNTAYTIWSRAEEEGAHPFVLLLSENGTASGLYVESSYPMDITLQRGYKINIVILSTALKIRLFLGPSMADVVAQYWSVIGSPARPPYWGLGHFYGSGTTSSYTGLVALMANHTKLFLPVEGVLLPNLLNADFQPFTFSEEIISYLETWYDNNGTSFIITVPPTITTSTGDSTWFMDSAGLDQKVFLLSSENTPISGLLNNKIVKYPDFSASNVASWWSNNITAYSHGYGFHLHKNTPYSEINGSVGSCADLDTDLNLATEILNLRNLEENTLCLSAIGKKGLQLEAHNKFAWQQGKITQSTLLPWSVSKHPLIISDASSPGSGRFAGHFHDSSTNSYVGLRAALNELVSYNFLGIPITGPNLCTKELVTPAHCVKWYYLSVISPIAWSMSADLPHLFNSNTTFIDTLDTILQFRQQLLHYHYDSLYKAHTEKEVPLRFLSFDFPTDTTAAMYQDQVLLGDSILYTPILRAGEEYRVSYLPAGRWCNWVDGSCYTGPTEVTVTGTNAPASFTFLKGGTAIVTQNSANRLTTARGEKVRLIIALDEAGTANCTRFFDDGETANTLQTKYYSLINYSVANGTLTVTLPHDGYRGGVMQVKYERILIYGLSSKVTTVSRASEEVRGSSMVAGDTDYYKLIVSDTSVDIALDEEFTLTWQ